MINKVLLMEFFKDDDIKVVDKDFYIKSQMKSDVIKYIIILEEENERLNNIIDEIEWKPISEYQKPKYDWVLIKYYIEPEFECIPTVAEERFGKWYDRNDNEIFGEVRYFMDMQQIDKLKELKEGK